MTKNQAAKELERIADELSTALVTHHKTKLREIAEKLRKRGNRKK